MSDIANVTLEPDEIEITPEMIEAGLAEYCGNDYFQRTEETVKRIFLAMWEAMATAEPKETGRGGSVNRA